MGIEEGEEVQTKGVDKWMELEDIILSEVSQVPKAKGHTLNITSAI
jgi:hypothetical protein